MIALIMLMTFTAAAHADLRTGSAPNKYPMPEDSSPTRPQLKRVDLRYDDTAGALQATISFYDPLADTASTSALRPWHYSVTLGDYLNGICTGDRVGFPRTSLVIGGSLADPAHATLDSDFDINETFADVPLAGTLSPDRTQLTLAVTDPRLAGLNLICADAGVVDTRQSKHDFSETFAFLLDGYDAADGALSREVRHYLTFETDTVAVRLRPRRGQSGARVTCRELYPATFSCHARGPLRNVRGDATVRVDGQMSFDARGARKLGGGTQHAWQADMRATVSWKRCPKDARPKSLRGKPCHIRAKWTGTRTLADALGV
jgi:hypothetical protein